MELEFTRAQLAKELKITHSSVTALCKKNFVYSKKYNKKIIIYMTKEELKELKRKTRRYPMNNSKYWK